MTQVSLYRAKFCTNEGASQVTQPGRPECNAGRPRERGKHCHVISDLFSDKRGVAAVFARTFVSPMQMHITYTKWRLELESRGDLTYNK